VTLVASAVLGMLANFALSPLAPLLAWTVIAVLLGLRLLSRPAAMVPRHEPQASRASAVTRLLLALTLVLLALLVAQAFGWIDFALWSEGQSLARSAATRSVLAAAGIFASLAYAGNVARRTQAFTFAIALLLLISPVTTSSLFAQAEVVEQAFLLAAGCAFTVAWLRRGDKRARVLAAVAFTGLATFTEHGLPLALAGWAGFVAFTPRPSLVATSKLWIAGLLFALLFGRATLSQIPTRPSNGVLETLLALCKPTAYPLLIALTLLGFLFYALKKSPGSQAIDAPRREGGAAFFVLASALLASPWQPDVLLPLAVLASFASLLSIVPADKSNASK